MGKAKGKWREANRLPPAPRFRAVESKGQQGRRGGGGAARNPQRTALATSHGFMAGHPRPPGRGAGGGSEAKR